MSRQILRKAKILIRVRIPEKKIMGSDFLTSFKAKSILLKVFIILVGFD